MTTLINMVSKYVLAFRTTLTMALINEIIVILYLGHLIREQLGTKYKMKWIQLGIAT